MVIHRRKLWTSDRRTIVWAHYSFSE